MTNNEPPKQDDQTSARKSAEATAGVASVCAVVAVVGGAYFQAAWPGAVAACAICMMGAVIGYLQMKSR